MSIFSIINSTLNIYIKELWFTLPITIYAAVEIRRPIAGEELFIVKLWKKIKDVYGEKDES